MTWFWEVTIFIFQRRFGYLVYVWASFFLILLGLSESFQDWIFIWVRRGACKHFFLLRVCRKLIFIPNLWNERIGLGLVCLYHILLQCKWLDAEKFWYSFPKCRTWYFVIPASCHNAFSCIFLCLYRVIATWRAILDCLLLSLLIGFKTCDLSSLRVCNTTHSLNWGCNLWYRTIKVL